MSQDDKVDKAKEKLAKPFRYCCRKSKIPIEQKFEFQWKVELLFMQIHTIRVLNRESINILFSGYRGNIIVHITCTKFECKGSSVRLYPSQVLGSGKLFSAPKEINNTKINTNYSS